MNVLTSVKVALRALSANKLRTTLTLLGIVIGVSAVISLMSIGRGAQEQITAQIQGLGTNLLFVRPGSTSSQGVRTGAGQAVNLTYVDAQALENLPNVVAVAPEIGRSGQLVYSGQNWSTRIMGVTVSYATVRNQTVAEGEWLSRAHQDARSSVVVLGHTVAHELFGDVSPVGQTVRISMFGRTGFNFRVIGVTESKGSSAFGSQDDVVYVPLSALQARLFAQRTATGQQNVSTINVQVADEDLMDATVAEIGEVLRTRHRVAEDDFTLQSQQDFLQTFSQITQTFTLLLGAIAGISLVVGGIGIMNIMLVSVTERTREIGIRKAVGARRSDILTQFLVEAIVVSLLGGALGIAAGAGIAQLISTIQIPSTGGGAPQSLQTSVGLDSVMLAFGVSAAVGLYFGIYPATRASRLNPIEALRYE